MALTLKVTELTKGWSKPLRPASWNLQEMKRPNRRGWVASRLNNGVADGLSVAREVWVRATGGESLKQRWRTRRRLAFLPGLEIGRVRTTTCRAGDVSGGDPGCQQRRPQEGLSSERRWKDIGGILRTEEKFKRQEESAKS